MVQLDLGGGGDGGVLHKAQWTCITVAIKAPPYGEGEQRISDNIH